MMYRSKNSLFATLLIHASLSLSTSEV